MEFNGLKVGESILIPDGLQPTAPASRSRPSSSGYADSGVVYGFSPVWGGKRLHLRILHLLCCFKGKNPNQLG